MVRDYVMAIYCFRFYRLLSGNINVSRTGTKERKTNPMEGARKEGQTRVRGRVQMGWKMEMRALGGEISTKSSCTRNIYSMV